MPVQTDQQLAKLYEAYPNGSVVTIDTKQYFETRNAVIAALATDDPGDDETCVIAAGLYYGYLTDRGLSVLGEFGPVVSFSGEVEPNVNFIYGTDYFLGDIVTIRNEYGISVRARIVEVQEVYDDNGYSVTPKFEIIEE